MLSTYLVRTQADQTLIGIFCASSVKALAQLLSPMADPEECEYLALRANEGLFVEAQFVHVPAISPEGSDAVFLTNVPEQYLDGPAPEDDEPDPMRSEFRGSELESALEEQIPPVLEPSEGLNARLQVAEKHGWAPLCPKTPHTAKPAGVPAVRMLCGESSRRH